MFVKLRGYLAELEAQEQNKPPSAQQPVPTIADLARALGMSHQALSNIANNEIKQLNLETGAKIIAEIRRRGFAMEVSDLIAYAEQAKAS